MKPSIRKINPLGLLRINDRAYPRRERLKEITPSEIQMCYLEFPLFRWFDPSHRGQADQVGNQVNPYCHQIINL